MNNETITAFDAALADLDIPGDNYDAADLIMRLLAVELEVEWQQFLPQLETVAKQMTPLEVARALLVLHVYGPGLAVLLWEQIEHLRGQRTRGWDFGYLSSLIDKARKLSLHRRLRESNI